MSSPSEWPTVHVVAAALFRDDPVQGLQLFVARRGPGRRHAGLWELPGGQVEAGETEPQALVREIQEELKVEIRLQQRLGEATVPAAGVRVRMGAWRAEITSGEPVLIDHDEARWVRPADFEELSWAPADIPLIPALVAEWQK